MKEPIEYHKNLLKVLHFAMKQNFEFLDQIKNLEITLVTLLKKIKEFLHNEELIQKIKGFERELGSFSFAGEEQKKRVISDIYETFKNEDYSNISIEEAKKSSLSFFFNSLKDYQFISNEDREKLALKGIQNVMDILYTLPKKYEDYTKIDQIESASVGKEVQILGYVTSKKVITGKRVYMEIQIQTQRGVLKVILFNYKQLQFLFKIQIYYLLRGVLSYNTFYGYHLVHPFLITLKSPSDSQNYLTYSLKYGDIGVLDEQFSNYIKDIIAIHKEEFNEILSEKILKDNGYPTILETLTTLHSPNPSQVDFSILNSGESIYHQRLKFEEFFLLRLVQLMKKDAFRNRKGISISIDFKLHQDFLKSIPFELTFDQLKAISDLFEDLRLGYPANRLIQGDVGSGKTVVVASAMLQCVKAGYQAIIMVPTEILAYQHHATLTKMMKSFNIGVQLLVSKMKKKDKDTVILQLEHGAPQIYVGTHALIQKQIRYNNPGLVIIDEQHRFGVLQRKTLQEITAGINVTLLSATPIPRTLSMGIFGDLDITYIETMPKSRKPVKTASITEDKKDKVWRFIKGEISKGHQAYIIFPLIDESDVLNANALLKEYEKMSSEDFPDILCGLLHGKMKVEEKDDIMRKFHEKEIEILFATTVVEVGIDVPNATVMTIMNAERFGLSQLHQLRGRVGRGSAEAFCFLISPQSDVKRLKILEKSSNGFEISREDLKLRGPGDIYGIDQSGVPKFRFVDFDKDEAIILNASQIADRYLKYDPGLIKNRSLREFLEKLKDNSYWNIS